MLNFFKSIYNFLNRYSIGKNSSDDYYYNLGDEVKKLPDLSNLYKENLYFQPVILGLEHGVTFANEKKTQKKRRRKLSTSRRVKTTKKAKPKSTKTVKKSKQRKKLRN